MVNTMSRTDVLAFIRGCVDRAVRVDDDEGMETLTGTTEAWGRAITEYERQHAIEAHLFDLGLAAIYGSGVVLPADDSIGRPKRQFMAGVVEQTGDVPQPSDVWRLEYTRLLDETHTAGENKAPRLTITTTARVVDISKGVILMSDRTCRFCHKPIEPEVTSDEMCNVCLRTICGLLTGKYDGLNVGDLRANWTAWGPPAALAALLRPDDILRKEIQRLQTALDDGLSPELMPLYAEKIALMAFRLHLMETR